MKPKFVISNPTNWSCYNEHNPKLFLKINQQLKSMGFKQVFTRITPAQIYEEFTLVICPNYSELGSYDYFSSKNEATFSSVGGYSNGYYGRYKYETIGEPLKIEGDIFAIYLRERNLVCLVYPIYNLNGEDNKFIFHLLGILKEGLKILKAGKIKVDKNSVLITNFARSIDQSIQNVTDKSQVVRSNISSYQSNLMSEYQKLRESVIQERSLRDFKKNVKEKLKEEIKRFKELKFIKNIRLNSDSISYDTESIKINYGGKTYELGEFHVRIYPLKVVILNKNPFKDGEHYLHHPHMDHTHSTTEEPYICWGTFHPKLAELLTNFRLKELAILVNMYLKTYRGKDEFYKIDDFERKK